MKNKDEINNQLISQFKFNLKLDNINNTQILNYLKEVIN